MRPDLDHAAAFLSALSGRDGWGSVETFQTITDRKTDPRLNRVSIGYLSCLGDALERRNQQGAGVFVTINRCDGLGRRTENVVSLRALCIDADGPLEIPYALPPSITVQTKRGQHAYWLLTEDQPLAAFTPTQKRLAAYYATDPNVCDLPRVMRVPGFLHQKGEPFMVRATSLTERRYSLAEVVAAHPVSDAAIPVIVPILGIRSERAFLGWAACRPTHEGNRNRNAYVIAMEGLRRGLDTETVAVVVRDFCRRAGIQNEAETVIRSAIRNNERRVSNG